MQKTSANSVQPFATSVRRNAQCSKMTIARNVLMFVATALMNAGKWLECKEQKTSRNPLLVFLYMENVLRCD